MLLDGQALLIPRLLITSRLPSEGGLWAMNSPSADSICCTRVGISMRIRKKRRKKKFKVVKTLSLQRGGKLF